MHRSIYTISLLALLSLFTGFAWGQIANNPTAHYQLNGGFFDATGNSAPALPLNVGFGTDRFGNALAAAQLNGRSMLTGPQVNVSSLSKTTFTGWFLPFLENQHATVLYIGNASSSGFGILIKRAADRVPGKNVVLTCGGAYESRDTNIVFPDNAWVHFAVTKNNNIFSVYINGALVSSINASYRTTTAPLFIGATPDHFQNWGNSFVGLVDDIRLYNKALTSIQMDSLYRAERTVLNPQLATLAGQLYFDANSDCAYDSLDTRLANKTVIVNPGNLHVPTDANGRFQTRVSIGATYTVTPQPDGTLLTDTICADSARLLNHRDSAFVSVGVQGRSCARLVVNLSTVARRRCFTMPASATVRNEGFLNSQPATLRLSYPEGLINKSASLALTSPAAGIYEVAIPALRPGSQFTLRMQDSVACRDSLLNRSLCVTGKLLNAANCIRSRPSWDGSNISVSSRCFQSAFLRFVIRNTGAAMADSSNYRFIIDEGLVSRGKYQIGAGDSLVFDVLDQQETWALEVDQSAGAPGPRTLTTILSRCGIFMPPGPNPLSLAINPIDSGDAFATDCSPVVDSYDPNDKLVFPNGFGPTRIMEPGTKLTYKIRFQNKGTASTFFVNMTDTLTDDLDINTLQRGTESHPGAVMNVYKADGKNVIRYSYASLVLPHETVDTAGSNGFVTFSISPVVGLALGTRISNKAAIYFDYNRPVITDPVIITVDAIPAPTRPIVDPVVLGIKHSIKGITIYPNPAGRILCLEGAYPNARIQILDQTGRASIDSKVINQRVSLEGLAPGMYIYHIQNGSDMVTGKFIKN